MRIVIDLQGAQTESQFRGIGRYSLSLVLAIAKNAGSHEIHLVLNSAFPTSVLQIRQEFEGLIPSTHIHVFTTPLHVAECYYSNPWLVRSAEKIREFFIQRLQPDMVLVTSLFEGYLDDAVTSVGSFSTGINTAVILYDLIPFLNPDAYLPEDSQKQFYYRKIESLKKAGLLLAISDYSRRSVIETLGFAQERVVNISTAVESFFNPKNLSPEEAKVFCQQYGITRKIVLCVPGGFDARKNMVNLIKAYSLLSPELRASHQLVISSKIHEQTRQQIEEMRKQAGLDANELVLTDYVSNEDLVTMYNLAVLFVFPSLCEGFGLPVLEAMSCGAPVIGSNSTSIPDVIGHQDALFDADSPESIAEKMKQLLCDEPLRLQFREHSLKQAKKFSWDEVAKRALHALENQVETHSSAPTTFSCHLYSKKPRLAFVSPLPPERTGIADYCVELLSELVHYFEVELVTNQTHIILPPHLSALVQRSTDWFKENGSSYDRIMYQFGNSPFHSHMLQLLEKHPGVVDLHDFYLSSMLAFEEMSGFMPNVWMQALFHSHGYSAIQSLCRANDIHETDRVKNRYPCNLSVLQSAKGIIVHSNYSQELASRWYGAGVANDWNKIPLLRCAAKSIDRQHARQSLNISDDAFVVCSFGQLAPTKLNHRLLQAWVSSQLNTNPHCELIFVGANHGGDYGLELSDFIHRSHCKRIRVTGWVEREIYNQYLQAADVGVQLRSASRGETSAAVLDCMNYGLATVVNANGTMAELPSDAIWMLADEFSDDELIKTLETLWQDEDRRQQLGLKSRKHIQTQHDPIACANRYFQTIENIYQKVATDQHALIKSILSLETTPSTDEDLRRVAQATATSSLPQPLTKQLLIDVTTIAQSDLKTGIERVVRAQLLELIKSPPQGFRVEPVYLSQEEGAWCYRYARHFVCKLLGMSFSGMQNTPIEICSQDIFYALDFSPGEIIQTSKAGLFLQWRALGVQINVLVYDLLPILKPQFFPKGTDLQHAEWLAEIIQFADRLIGISSTVANELQQWMKNNSFERLQPLMVCAAPLGADIIASAPTSGLPNTAAAFLKQLKGKISFLMVGTIEPRKGYLQTLVAFEELWQQGNQVTLIIVGQEGWTQLKKEERRNVLKIVDRILQHPELGKRLFWLQNASDEYLQKLYETCTCFLAASEGEGFGLPLIEAARYKLPIIASNLPVFREIAQENVFYFDAVRGHELARAVTDWLSLYVKGEVPSSAAIQWNTWAQNVNELKIILSGQKHERVWLPTKMKQKAIDEHLKLIHAARVEMVSSLLPQGNLILDLGGANSPLYTMGYPYRFEKLTLIDLPADQRHEYYKDIVVDSQCELGQVVLRYTDMTQLEDFADHSVDFVWSGQSIEHVPHELGEKMCREAFRVLKKGGAFCLDTPNRYLTQIHTRSIGGGFIHPEHYIEYFPEQLKEMLMKAGFFIKVALGICEMPETVATNEFHYSDFMFGKKITNNISHAYIQFFHCVKM